MNDSVNNKNYSFKIHDGSGVAEVVVGGNAGDIDKELNGTAVDMSKSQGVQQVDNMGNVKSVDTISVQTHEDTPLSITTSWGSRATLEQGLKDPDNFMVTIGNTKTTLSAALKGGLINTDGKSVEAIPMPQQMPNELKQPKFDSPMVSTEGQAFIKECYKREDKRLVDDALASVFAAVGSDQSKQKYAIEKFSSTVHIEPDVAERNVNRLIVDLGETLQTRIEASLGDPDLAAGAIDVFVEKFDRNLKSNLLLRLYNGDRQVAAEVMQRVIEKRYF